MDLSIKKNGIRHRVEHFLRAWVGFPLTAPQDSASLYFTRLEGGKVGPVRTTYHFERDNCLFSRCRVMLSLLVMTRRTSRPVEREVNVAPFFPSV